MSVREAAAMTGKRIRQISRLLSYVLRHRPEHVGVSLDGGGWTSIEELLQRLNACGHAVSIGELRASPHVKDGNGETPLHYAA